MCVLPSLIRDERLFFLVFFFYNFHREILELLFFLKKGFYFAVSYDCKPEMLMKINI